MFKLSEFLPRSIRRRIILSKTKIDTGAIGHVRVKLVESDAESLGAARVVHDSYVSRGILAPHQTGIYASKFSASPGTWTLAATLGSDVVGTMSLVCDDGSLPMDGVYGAELRGFRAAGERLGEVGALAIAPGLRRSGLVLWLNRAMLRLAIDLELDRLVAAVHPDAEDVYGATLLFTRFGPEREYPGLNASARSVALCLSLEDVEARFRATFGAHGELPCETLLNAYFGPNPQVQQPRDLRVKRRTARQALRRARPDIIPPRPSLASYVELEQANGGLQ